jgi:hypothetical protein
MKTRKTVNTTWELWTYDVWGNKEEGFEVNDKTCFYRSYEINLKIENNNPNTPMQFLSAYPSNYQIEQAFNTNCQFELDGDDIHIYINRTSDNYPIGEMFCTSHASLSPIRFIEDKSKLNDKQYYQSQKA